MENLKDGKIDTPTTCEYVVKDKPCTKDAVERINGYALCSTHKKFGGTMDPKKGHASAMAADEAGKTAEIEAGNKDSEFRSAQKPPISSFTLDGLYRDLDRLENGVLLHLAAFKNGTSIASKINAAKMSVLKESGRLPEPYDPRQLSLPVDTKNTIEKSIEDRLPPSKFVEGDVVESKSSNPKHPGPHVLKFYGWFSGKPGWEFEDGGWEWEENLRAVPGESGATTQDAS